MQDTLRAYLSSLNGKLQLTPQPEATLTPAKLPPTEITLIIDPSVKHQPILGLGGTMLDTDVCHLMRMSPPKRAEMLSALFEKKDGAGWNFIRVPLGSTDWERSSDYYTYDDMPRGSKDWNLEHFSMHRDIGRALPDLLHSITKINPDVVFLASVWGVPGWMKENDSIMFGRFNPECTGVYARYLRKAVQAWSALGIEFYAITTQNEPLTSDDRATPACRFTWRMQAPVIKALKQEFLAHNIKTQIWCFDHNFNLADAFVGPLLKDPDLYAVIDGVAFHDYGGSPKVMGGLRAMYPNMPFYMTETHVWNPSGLSHLVDQFRNGSRSYLQWTSIADEYNGPHQFLGTPFIYPGEPAPLERRNFVYNHRDDPDNWGKGSSWGLYAQFTRFLRRDMVRIDSSFGHVKWVTTVAFQHPDGEIAVVVVNQTAEEQSFALRIGRGEYSAKLPAQAIGTWLIAPGVLCASEYLPVSSAPEKLFTEPPAFDLEITDIRFEHPVKAGGEAVLMARVRNAGNSPTPKDCPMFVYFSLDGDCPIGRSVTVPAPIRPGNEIQVAANIPFGKKPTWTVEPGYHLITANVILGNTAAERNTDNNLFSKEFHC